MYFMEAAWYLREAGVIVEWSDEVRQSQRFYKLYDKEDKDQAVWLLPKAICSFAERVKGINSC